MERKTVTMPRMYVLLALLGGIYTSAAAQTPGTTYDDLQSALEKATAGADRPGDGSLSCEALEGELVAVAKAPALQSYITKMGAVAQEKIDAMNAASRAMAAQTAMTIFSSIVPGGAWVGQAAAAAQLPAQQALAARNLQQTIQQAQELIPIMPQLMRGQRVLELAQARNCAWVRQQG